MNYYNDNDPRAAAWLRRLIADGHLPPGDVDQRSITDVNPDDLAPYDQCHFFAGIGGWPLALRWAGLENARGIWTGSCPCQPLSCAGKRQGHADARHLWPAFHALIAQRLPPVVFGEQVASADGREWLAGIRLDLEDLGYACGAADLCAAGLGAPHRRQRIYWVGDSRHLRLEGPPRESGTAAQGESSGHTVDSIRPHPLAHTGGGGSPQGISEPEQRKAGDAEKPDDGCGRISHPLADAPMHGHPPPDGLRAPPQPPEQAGTQRLRQPPRGRDAGPLAYAAGGQRQQLLRPQGNGIQRPPDDSPDRSLGDPAGRGRRISRDAPQPRRGGHPERPSWAGCRRILCRDGKTRRIPAQPALFPLADGLPGRVGLLRGAGNAIVPQVAEAFIRAWLAATADTAKRNTP